MKKSISLLIIMALLISLVACGGEKSKSSTSNSQAEPSKTESQPANSRPSRTDNFPAGTYAITSENAKPLGRTFEYKDIFWLSLSGSGCEFNFTGTTLEFMLRGDTMASDANHTPRYAIYVDGEEVVKKTMDAPIENVKVLEGTESASHVVKFVKLSESSDSTMGIVKVVGDENAVISPTENKALKIEFIGDSITCGYGVDDPLGGKYKTSNEDCTKAYAIKTANKLDADYSLVSFSGYGIVSGYTSGDKNTASTLPQYYDKFGNSYSAFIEDKKPSTVDWDFSFTPDFVVVNLGTNDDSYCKGDAAKKEEYVSLYVEFLKVLREKNPNAKIICALGLMGNALYPQVEEAVNRYSEETGDKLVYAFQLDTQDSSLGFAVDYHPVEANHEHAADQMAEFINSLK